MMQENESHALEKILRFEDSIRRYTKEFEGEIIKTYGDGCLLLFTSAVNAVQCAIKIQTSLKKNPRVPLRIGVHIGEVVRKENDIFGNGVNLASRIESMGVANSVLISSDVYVHIKNHPKLKAIWLGSFNFKNVDELIDLYAIKNQGLTIPIASEMKGKGVKKRESLDWNRWLIKGIVLVCAVILLAVVIFKLSPSNGSSELLTENIDALDLFLKGEFHHKQETLSDIDTAIVYYQRAIDQDPQFAMAYSNLASAYMRKHLSFDPSVEWEKEAYSAAGQALSIDPKLANPHLVRGQFFWSPSHGFAHEEAMHEFKQALDKDPGLSQAFEQLALVQLHIGLFESAIKNATKSLDLDPSNFRARRFVAEALLFKGDHEASIKEFEKIPDNFTSLTTLSFKALNLVYLGKYENARELLKNKLKEHPENPNLNSIMAVLYALQGKPSEAEYHVQVAVDNSRDYIHAHHVYYHLGLTSALMNQKEIALQWLKNAADSGFPCYPLYLSDTLLANLRDYPQFLVFLSSLKEQWEYFLAMKT